MDTKLFLLFLSLTFHGQGHHLWNAGVPQQFDLVLEKGKPLQLPQPYEKVQISGLKGTLYSDSLSQLHGVRQLRIHKHGLVEMEKGALCSAPDVKALELDFQESKSNLTHLTKDMFQNCDHIEELSLKFNSEKDVYKIDQNALEDLGSLTFFSIQGYKIEHIFKNFLKINPNLLKTLTVQVAQIKKVDPDAFEDFSNLESLVIRHNKNWTEVPLDLLKKLKNLQTISLRDNSLQNLTWDEFQGLDKVKFLDLGSNRLVSFDAEKIAKNLPSLERLYIELNVLKCKVAEAFAEDLKKRYDHPVEIEYKFDPGFYDPCTHAE